MPQVKTVWRNGKALWSEIYTAPEPQGRIAVGMRIDFTNQMKDIPPQYILSDFMVDRIYPVEAGEGTSELAYCDNDLLVGTGKEMHIILASGHGTTSRPAWAMRPAPCLRSWIMPEHTHPQVFLQE